MTTIVYALADPTTKRVRYVGKTVNALKARYSTHMAKARRGEVSHVYNWIRALLAEDKRPVAIILQECEDDKGAEAEMAWIRRGYELGWPLTNHTLGGEGRRLHPVPTEEAKRKAQELLHVPYVGRAT